MTNLYNFEISVTDGDSTVNVESLGLPAPRSTFMPYQESVPCADGSARGLGWESAIWEWDSLTKDQYDILESLCPGASVPCWNRTLKGDYETYAYYAAIMRRSPPPDQRRAGRALQIRYEFVALVEYEPTPPPEPEPEE
jgi:hypothetical protein